MLRFAFVFPALAVSLLLAGCKERQPTRPGEIVVEAERVAASKADTPRDIQPYDEALSWHEYRVKRVLGGEVSAPVIRVAHWTVVAAKAVPVSAKKGEVVRLKLTPFDDIATLKDVKARDDLDQSIDFAAATIPRFLDVSQPLVQANPPTALRYDYHGNISEQMRLYWALRGQLRTVIMGNSHATKGVSPRVIMDADGWGHPDMLNLAPAGANNDQQCLMLREYVLPLQKLQWLLWVVSARNFNASHRDSMKWDSFISSPGLLYDQQHKHELWPVPSSAKLVNTEELKEMMGPMDHDLWGSMILNKSLLPEDPIEQRKEVLDRCWNATFSWDEAAFSKFCETAQLFARKGVKVLVFTTPFHPVTREAKASDPDRTSHEGFRGMTRHMEEFARTTPRVWFRDFNNDGANGFPPDEFYDSDHLSRPGTTRLGKMIREWMTQCALEDSASGVDSK